MNFNISRVCPLCLLWISSADQFDNLMNKSIVNNRADPSRNSRQFAFYNNKGIDILSCV